MAKEWIENLAQDVKQKNREAAENYGRTQHYAGVMAEHGKEFFVGLVADLKENVDAFRRHYVHAERLDQRAQQPRALTDPVSKG